MIECQYILSLCDRFEAYLILPLKFCPKCKLWKSRGLEFYKSSKSRDGHQGHCEKCNRQSVDKYQATPKGKRTRVKARAKYQKSEKFKSAKAKYLATPKGMVTQKRAVVKYRKTAKAKATKARYRSSTTGKLTEALYRASAKGQEVQQLSDGKYRRSSKGKAYIASSNAKRRALKRNAAICDFTSTQWRTLQERFDHRCAYCGKRAKGRLSQDHIIPLSKGGNHTLSNIVPACQACNRKKSDGAPLRSVQPYLLLA
jgi:5-methylcytosine-specific restriction endonuclease McrA